MRLVFRASEGGFDAAETMDCLVCGFSGRDASDKEHYANFQRGVEGEDPSEDCGVHFEFDDQSSGAYNCVRQCRLSRAALEVELAHTMDWGRQIDGVSIDLTGLEEESYEAIRGGLPRIFRGMAGILEVF